jgi:hypothetical protein
MIQIITSPDIVANNKLAKKISKQLDIYRINISIIININTNLNQCLIDLYSLLEKHKRLIIYGQCIDNNQQYKPELNLVSKLMEYIMTNLHYQLVIHNLKNDEDVDIIKPYYKLNQYHRLKRYDDTII